MAGISVVIPTLNESGRIASSVRAILEQPGFTEVIVVDGGSTDDTTAIAEAAGAKVVTSSRGRAVQMNAGAAIASGELLLFLHADVSLPPAAAIHIAHTLAPAGVVAGAFKTWTYNDPDAGGTWRFGILVHVADLRSRLTNSPYGDQGLFLSREQFHAIGGFPNIALMEDTAIAKRLRAKGRIAIAPASVRVSARRWQERPFTTILIMNTFPMAYRLGVSPERLGHLYAAIR